MFSGRGTFLCDVTPATHQSTSKQTGGDESRLIRITEKKACICAPPPSLKMLVGSSQRVSPLDPLLKTMTVEGDGATGGVRKK